MKILAFRKSSIQAIIFWIIFLIVACTYVVPPLIYALLLPPKQSHYPHQLVFTTLLKDQGLYIAEWIEFHHMLGVELFIIYDHGSTDNTLQVLEPYIKSGIVEYMDAPKLYPDVCGKAQTQKHSQGPCQQIVFRDAKDRYRGKTRWFSIIDVDEYVYPMENETHPPSLVTALRKYEDYNMLGVVSLVFGSNGHKNITYRQPGELYNPLTLEMFTRRSKVGREIGHGQKCFVRLEVFNIPDDWVHFPTCHICHRKVIYPLGSDIRMNHYQFKSLEETNLKRIANNNDFIFVDDERERILNEVYDDAVQYLVDELKKRLIMRGNKN